MAYTETTTTSYGQRLGKSLKGIIGGLLMFVIGTGLLWWNEGRAVKTTRAIEEAESVVVEMENVTNVDPAFDGKLVHASAFADTKETLSDLNFGVKEVAVRLIRDVEYYQYKEHSHTETRDKVGGGEETTTTYTYDLKWSDEPINSANFKDPAYRGSNFVLTNIEDNDLLAKKVTFGAYILPNFIKEDISGKEAAMVNMTKSQMQTAQQRLSANNRLPQQNNQSMIHVNENEVYYGQDSNSPTLGDVRVRFYKILPKDISIIAKVNKNTFEEYIAKNGMAFSSIAMGTVSAEVMFQTEHDNNTMLTWLYRLVGIVLVIAGLKSLFSILPTLFKVLPFLGNLVEVGVGLVCAVLGFAWSLIIIALAWLFYRPILGITLLLIVVGLIVYFSKKGKKKKQKKQKEEESNLAERPVQHALEKQEEKNDIK